MNLINYHIYNHGIFTTEWCNIWTKRLIKSPFQSILSTNENQKWHSLIFWCLNLKEVDHLHFTQF
jgi:hypothetical protein